ncbi:MAG: S-layer homology domain-containing protein [Bacillota bacterium]
MKKSIMKQSLALGMATALSVGTATTSFATSVFVDIDTVPWAGAADIVNQAYEYGLLNGSLYEGERYARPRADLSYCEAVQLAYSVMKVYTRADVSDAIVTKWTQIMSAYELPTWAYPAVAYCLENEFLPATELTKLKDGTEATTYKITREEVGVLFGKLLTSIYGNSSMTSLPYSDASGISSASVPYLALLNEKQIMVGDANGSFRPDAKLNRAEVSVITVFTYELLSEAPPQEETSGTLYATVQSVEALSNGDVFISLITENRVDKNLLVSKSTSTVTYNGEAVSLSSIGVGDSVIVGYSGNDAKSVVITNSKVGIDIQSTYVLSSITSSTITVLEGTTSSSYTLADGATIYISGSASTTSALSTAANSSEYSVTLTFDSNGKVTKVEAVKSANNPLAGDLTYLSDSEIAITIGMKEYEYPVTSGDLAVTKDGASYSFSTLKSDYKNVNYMVDLELNDDGEVEAIKITFMEDETNGILSFMTSTRLELTANDETYKYTMDTSECEVTINGKSSSIADLLAVYDEKQFLTSLTLDRDDYVIAIDSVEKNMGYAGGELKSITSSTVTIYDDGKTLSYDLNSPTITIDGQTISSTDFRSYYSEYSYEVELEFDSSGKVIAITGTNLEATKGTLKNVEPTKDEIQITIAGINYTYDVSSSATIKIDGTTSDLDDLDEAYEDASWSGKTIAVTVALNSSGEVTSITAVTSASTTSVEETINGEYVSSTANTVTITSAGEDQTYTISYSEISDSIYIEGKSSQSYLLFNHFEDYENDLFDGEILVIELEIDKYGDVISIDAILEVEKNTQGTLIAVSGRYDKIEIKGTNSTNSIWTVADDMEYTVNWEDFSTSQYNESHYSEDSYGLEDLLEDVTEDRNTITVKLTANNNGEIDQIDVTIVD